ncbi:unnamed protein product, partial [Rotaria socialis]
DSLDAALRLDSLDAAGADFDRDGNLRD